SADRAAAGGPVSTTIERTAADLSVGRFLRVCLALLSAGAGVIHLAVAGDHLDHPLLVAFFDVAGVLQLAWAWAMVRRPDRRVFAAGLAGQAAIVGIWVVSRTTGLPGIAGADAVEPVGAADLISTLLE